MTHSPLKNVKGMSLIEVMIVMAIIGGMMALGVSILFPGSEAQLRDQAIRLAATIKFLYNEAAIKNRYYRLVFDLDSQAYSVESSSESFLVAVEEEDSLKTKLSAKPEGEEPPATPEAGFTAEEGLLAAPTRLPKSLKFKDVQVAHMQEKQSQGKVFAYFFPNGWVERMVVNMTDEDEENFYSLEVNPLTGKSKILNEYKEAKPEELRPEVTQP